MWWIHEEKRIKLVNLLHLKDGIQIGKLLWEDVRIIKWRREYLAKRVCGKAEGTQKPSLFLDKTYIHKNHTSNFTWHLGVEGNNIRNPMGKGW